MIALPTKNTKNTQTSESGQSQSSVGANNVDANGSTSGPSTNDVYVIGYPLEKQCCQKCNCALESSNLTIRNHVIQHHNISAFKYLCSSCHKEYDSINSIRAHHNSCKKKKNADPGVTSSHQVNDQPSTASGGLVQQLHCEECSRIGQQFIVTDRIKLVTHMRHKHPSAYEQSKTVAQKRLAWTSDEDRILAGIEIKLKKDSKGQILNRLAGEWNKLVKNNGANKRSKGAILGRRQNLEYKRVLAEMINEQEDTSASGSSDTEESEVSSDELSVQVQSAPMAGNSPVLDTSYEQAIQEYIKTNYVDHQVQLSPLIKDLVQLFTNHHNGVDLVQLSFESIQFAINEHKTKQEAGRRPPRTRPEKPKVYDLIRNQRRKEKAIIYQQYQRTYNKDKAKLVSVLLDGVDIDTHPPPIDIATNHYKNIWSVKADDNAPFRSRGDIDDNMLGKPITWQEIEVAIADTNMKTACGLDNVSMADLKRIFKTELTIAFNIWMVFRRIPKALKMNRTVLIPKGNQDLHDIRNWRPITIASTILRLYNKILVTRLNKTFRTSEKQMGFKPVNGCAYNILWLNNLLKHARRNRNNLYVCLLDVSKAFDSVPHQSIERALRRNNAPKMLIDIINDQYSNVYTSISYHDRSSAKIKIMRGVKQGDPLSSLLFNLVIDELFDLIKDDYGYEVQNGVKTNAKCFADDLVLVSGTKIGMGQLLNTTAEFLRARGLLTNPKKCISIGLAKAYKGKKSKIEAESIFQIDNISIPMLGYTTNTTRYLGVSFSSLGAAESSQVWNYVKEVLMKIEKVNLKPHQKIDLLRSYIIPRFIYVLTHTELYPKMLHQIDRYIRQTIRKILHLPVSLSNEFFYLSNRDGGLQIANLHDLVSIAKVKIIKSIKLSTDLALKRLIEQQGLLMNEHFLNAIQLGGIQPASDINIRKEQMMRERRLTYAKKIHGVGFEIFSTSPQTNRWLDGTFRGMNAKSYIQAIKLRTNSLETKVTCARGLSIPKLCSLCQCNDESIMHILQFCDATRGTRYARHHKVRFTVAESLRKKGFTVFEEQTYHPDNSPSSYTRPDIVAIKNKKAWVLDVTCVYEITGASFINAAEQRKLRYQPIESSVKEKHGCATVETLGLTIGSRGSFYHGHLHIWRSLGFNNTELYYLAMNCLQDSIKICSVFRKSKQMSTSRRSRID